MSPLLSMSSSRLGSLVLFAVAATLGAGIALPAASRGAADTRPAAAADGRTAVPTGAALAPAEKLIRELYGKQMADTSVKGRRELARKMLGEAERSKGDAAGQYALLSKCLELACEAGDVNTAFDAVGELEAGYAVDGPALAAEAVRKLAPKVTAADEQARLASEGLALIDRLMTAGRYGEAQALCPPVQGAAAVSANAAIKSRATAQVAAARSAYVEFQRLKPSFDALERNANDPQANEAVGKFYFSYGEAAKGLPLLAKGPAKDAKGADSPWKSLASRDLAEPADARRQADLAGGWWDLAQAQTGAVKERTEARAVYWYRRALPGLEGIARALAEKRIGAAAPAVGDAPAAAGSGAAAGGPAAKPTAPAGVAGPAAHVTVVSARWGGGQHWADVTPVVKELVADGKKFWANTRTLKADPTPGWRKHLQIVVIKDGKKKDVSVDEDKGVDPAELGQ